MPIGRIVDLPAGAVYVPNIAQKQRMDDNFITTYSGRRFYPLEPHPADIHIEDIAHALSLICRWTGHTRVFYSVAEHSLRVSRLAQQMLLKQLAHRPAEGIVAARELALWGLLHDASEAYICDLTRPLKHRTEIGRLYHASEAWIMDCVVDRFDLSPHMPSMVKDADRILLETERRDLICSGVPESTVEPLPETIQPMSSAEAEIEFLRRFEALVKARQAERAAQKP